VMSPLSRGMVVTASETSVDNTTNGDAHRHHPEHCAAHREQCLPCTYVLEGRGGVTAGLEVARIRHPDHRDSAADAPRGRGRAMTTAIADALEAFILEHEYCSELDTGSTTIASG
jgi:hypothetical protein